VPMSPGDGGPTRRACHPSSPRPDPRTGVNPHAAGWDIGSEASWACVPADRDAEPGRSFGTLPPDLYALADWLVACRMETVAMASTNVYGMPVYEMLEARGFRVQLVKVRLMSNDPVKIGMKPPIWATSSGRKFWRPWTYLAKSLFRPLRPNTAVICVLGEVLLHRRIACADLGRNLPYGNVLPPKFLDQLLRMLWQGRTGNLTQSSRRPVPLS
jgi:hypothetical protein